MSFALTPKQHAANKLMGGAARHILAVGGSRSAKTFNFVRGIMIRAIRAAHSRHAILRLRGNAARASIALDTLPKVQRLCFPQVRLTEHRQDGFFALPNASEIWVGGLVDKDRVEKILGNEYVTIFLNECSQISFASATTAITRLAQNVPGLAQKAYYDLNPVGKAHWTNRLFLEHRDPRTLKPLANPKAYAHLFMNPKDNRANLTAEYLESLENLPERQRRRFYEGRYADETEGALWTYETIEQNRVGPEDVPEGLVRVVVAVDPSGASGVDDENASEIGIIAAGLDRAGHAYIFEDASVRDSPAVWGRRVALVFHTRSADRVVAEKNFGGEMVRFVINTADKTVPVKVITASRGKEVRAEPVSALYEKGLVHHVGRFGALEDQMCSFSTLGYLGEGSPDRADALVWAITELLVGSAGAVDVLGGAAVSGRVLDADEEADRSGVGDAGSSPWGMR